MNKIEDIEMIDLVIVEQSKPVNKIGITVLEIGDLARTCSAAAGGSPGTAPRDAQSPGSETPLAPARLALLT
jgi:hypothetical protein